jgi:hypothetical protein
MFTKKQTEKTAKRLKINFDKFDLKQFQDGMNVELEHRNITKGSALLSGKIALAHLAEDKKYYSKLRKAGL